MWGGFGDFQHNGGTYWRNSLKYSHSVILGSKGGQGMTRGGSRYEAAAERLFVIWGKFTYAMAKESIPGRGGWLDPQLFGATQAMAHAVREKPP